MKDGLHRGNKLETELNESQSLHEVFNSLLPQSLHCCQPTHYTVASLLLTPSYRSLECWVAWCDAWAVVVSPCCGLTCLDIDQFKVLRDLAMPVYLINPYVLDSFNPLNIYFIALGLVCDLNGCLRLITFKIQRLIRISFLQIFLSAVHALQQSLFCLKQKLSKWTKMSFPDYFLNNFGLPVD